MKATKTKIDLTKYSRKDMFEFFLQKDYPVFSMVSRVDITIFKKFQQEKQYPFFIALSYLLSRVVNEISVFKHRIIDGELYEYSTLNTGFTIAKADNSFGFGDVPFYNSFEAYHAHVATCMTEVKQGIAQPIRQDEQSSFYITSIPWYDFTSFTHPYDPVNGSIPIVTIGKYTFSGENCTLPIGLQVNHAVMDGFHTGQFYLKIQAALNEPERFFLL